MSLVEPNAVEGLDNFTALHFHVSAGRRDSRRGEKEERSERGEKKEDESDSLKGSFSISQRKYVLDLLKETSMLGCKPANTPVDTTHQLSNRNTLVDKD
ncbi:putative mitochondrial protein [Cucumis melo var. makuwa]|uniref:Mitochondrial protein n=1 Tax=Cucumis melo var. makuwa TaxID=1194695 RepID=A0A5A7UV07_CUCMM|nr:putative mitochondrial protein [Cucumis melo var. makuwa]TYK13404.1 putative mitochondrial protein [Cucumis melo var. makuwa]